MRPRRPACLHLSRNRLRLSRRKGRVPKRSNHGSKQDEHWVEPVLIFFRELGLILLSRIAYFGTQPADLLQVMSSVNEVESAPLIDREWTEVKVIEDLAVSAELSGVASESFVHFRDLASDSGHDSFGRKSLGTGELRCLPTRGQVAQAEHD